MCRISASPSAVDGSVARDRSIGCNDLCQIGAMIALVEKESRDCPVLVSSSAQEWC